MTHTAILLTGAEIVTTSATRARNDLELAIAGFLARFRVRHTREGYACAIRQWVAFCDRHFVDPLHAQRGHIELWARHLEENEHLALSTVASKLNALAGLYRFAVIDDLIDKNPMEHVQRPSIPRISPRTPLGRGEFFDLIAAAKYSSHRDHALIRLLGVNGLRVSEAVGIDLTDIRRSEGEYIIHVTRKYGIADQVPLSTKTAWAVENTIDERTNGPLFLSREHTRLDRAGANRVVKRCARAAGITKHVTPHVLRHTFVALGRSAGIPDAEIQAGTGHRDKRMIDYYDGREKLPLARNATTTLDAFVDRAR